MLGPGVRAQRAGLGAKCRVSINPSVRFPQYYAPEVIPVAERAGGSRCGPSDQLAALGAASFYPAFAGRIRRAEVAMRGTQKTRCVFCPPLASGKRCRDAALKALALCRRQPYQRVHPIGVTSSADCARCRTGTVRNAGAGRFPRSAGYSQGGLDADTLFCAGRVLDGRAYRPRRER